VQTVIDGETPHETVDLAVHATQPYREGVQVGRRPARAGLRSLVLVPLVRCGHVISA